MRDRHLVVQASRLPCGIFKIHAGLLWGIVNGIFRTVSSQELLSGEGLPGCGGFGFSHIFDQHNHSDPLGMTRQLRPGRTGQLQLPFSCHFSRKLVGFHGFWGSLALHTTIKAFFASLWSTLRCLRLLLPAHRIGPQRPVTIDRLVAQGNGAIAVHQPSGSEEASLGRRQLKAI